MTVAELIKILQQLDPSKIVEVHMCEVESIQLNAKYPNTVFIQAWADSWGKHHDIETLYTSTNKQERQNEEEKKMAERKRLGIHWGR